MVEEASNLPSTAAQQGWSNPQALWSSGSRAWLGRSGGHRVLTTEWKAMKQASCRGPSTAHKSYTTAHPFLVPTPTRYQLDLREKKGQ